MVTKSNLARGIAILLVLLLIPAAVSASDWAQFQKDNYNSGVTSDKAPITNPVGNDISWEVKLSAPVDEAPVVVDDMVYFVGADGKVRSLYKVNGTEKWSTATSGGGFLLGNMGAGDGLVFVPTSDGKVFAIDSDTGEEKWNTSLDGHQMNTPATYSDGKVYVGEAMGGHKYFCLDAETGGEIWNRTSTTQSSSEGSYYWAGAAVIGDFLVYGDDDGHLVSVNKDTGADIQEIDVSSVFGVGASLIRSSVLYVEELKRIYFTSRGGYCYTLGFNSSTGTFDTSDKHIASIGYSTSTPAYYDGKIYVGAGGMYGGGSGLSCLDADLTDEDWHFVAGAVQSSPAITTAYDDGDGEVYIYFTINAYGGKVFCVNESGVEQWSWGQSGKTDYTLCGVAISDGQIFYGTDKAYAFGFATYKSLGEDIYITPEDSLQETIYAAGDGDNIIMAPGTYNVSLTAGEADLYINKSHLTFMADGGEVIITPEAGDDDPSIVPGLEGANDATGCDASEIIFSGITFGTFDMTTGSENLQQEQDLSSMSFENCTFDGGKYYLYNDSAVDGCTFNNAPQFLLDGDNIIIEENTGFGAWIIQGSYVGSGISINKNSITSIGNISIEAKCLMADNVFETPGQISLYENPNCIICYNEFRNSSGTLTIDGEVYRNEIINCPDVVLGSGTGGSIYLNNIINCANVMQFPATYNTSVPVTYTYKGIYYTNYLGNYYSDYSGSDSNIDGIGDDPVTDSSNGGTDYYPTMASFNEDRSTIESSGFSISPEDSLQDAIYAADNGDTIWMAPGTYNITLTVGEADLYINKSDLTLIADGGDVFIVPDENDSNPCILPGKADAGDTAGCDASGTSFSGITFSSFQMGLNSNDLSTSLPNADISEMIFVNCTFTGETADCYLHDNSTVMACTFSGGPCMKVEGNDVTLEDNTGTWNEDAGISGGSGCTGLVIRDNSIVSGCINVSAATVMENNTFNSPGSFYCYSSPDNVIRNNEITNADGTVRLSGQVNTNYISGCGNVELGYDCGGTIILNNFIDCADVRMYPATYNTTSPVTYTYRSIEYTGYLGNYYSTLDGEDNNIDGVCEDAFVSSYGGSDTYPLAGPWIADDNNIETTGLTTCITPADSLQETIYAVENGDTIMMAPGTYNVSLVDGSVDLYINKSGLTFMADGGEVIISPEDGDSEPTIWPGKADANDVTGCDASGLTFSGITFEPFYISQYDLSSYPPNADFSEMSFTGCTFTGSKSYYYLRASSSVVNCTFNGGPAIYILGVDSRFENNTGNCKGYGGFYVGSSGLIVRNNSIASADIRGVGSVLLENNVFEAPGYFELTNYDNIFCNNEFINGSGRIKLRGNVFMNNFTNYYSVNLRNNDNTNIYLNNFVDCSTIQFYSYGSHNTTSPVSYTYGGQEYTGYLGNYYSSYTGTDSNGDGVGDESIKFKYGTDSYPLMGTWNADDNEIEVVAPVADFSADVTSGFRPLTVQFTDGSTDAESWSWDFNGDGIEDSNETNPQFTYAEAGTYNVTLTVSNSAGSDTETKVGYITCIQPLPVLSFAPVGASVSENHYTDIDITVSSLPDGLSGYNFTVSIADPGVAEIVGISYPSWANLTENSSLPGSSVYLKTLDGNSQLEAGAEDVVLATITVYGKEMGSTNLTLDIHRLDDDTGSEIEAELAVGTLEVTMTAIPGQTNSPQDLDGDGFYEDMTGDGSFSFVDVEVFFHQMDWIEDNLPVGDFDLNSNGRIDFDDIVDMFQMLA